MRILILILCSLAMPSSVADTFVRQVLTTWDYTDPAATEQKFLPLLDEAENDNQRAAVLSQLARTHSLRRNFEQAHAYLLKADRLLTDEMPLASVLVALERGRTFNSDNQKAEALAHFRHAFELAERHQIDDLAVDAAHMIAIAETGKRAERWHLIAMAIAETSDIPEAQKWLGALYNNLGWTYFDAGETTRALSLFEKGVAFRKAEDQLKAWQIARWTVARAWRELGRVDEALEEQTRLLEEAAGDEGQLGYIHEELGELYLQMQDTKQAHHFALAYDILSRDDWLTQNEPARLARLKELGNAHD